MTSGTLRILGVDDDADIRIIVTMALRLDPAIDARSVGSGAEALALLEANVWIPDLLLLDVNMPEMTGPELLMNIRHRWPGENLPAIFVTARAGRSVLEEFSALAVLGVILKPFLPAQLAGEVRALFDGSRIKLTTA